ncbi:citrate synthase [Occultella glacieicola]|uniref:citrate synthase (unknown stereospecificity) n=1 Tax=Occultella glacieicola TaxID=2518684 RepID=A0ABY2E5R0_9MICO|nr:citrate synthase [Occultella glacieicola]TDE94836.1 citrate synthase [Occultella glacieicola]
MSGPLPRLTTAQAAARLGVKPATLYAYVSRGLIASTRAEAGGGSTFDALDVERLAAARRRPREGGAGADRPRGRPLMVLGSPITLIEGDELYYRGVRATELARTHTLEAAVEVLWAQPPAVTGHGFETSAELLAHARAAGDLLGPAARLIDRLQLTVVIAGSHDPLRTDLTAASVHAAGRRLIATMVDALPDVGPPAPSPARLAQRLWPKLTASPGTPADLALLEATLVLCLDHDLAAATLAARVAASARAHPYAAITAALGAFDSAMHGSASTVATQMLREAGSGRPERVIAGHAARGRGIPGFGHVLYRRTDPRAAYLLARMSAMERYAAAIRVTRELVAMVGPRTGRPTNVDLALAVLAVGADMGDDAGQAIFAVARTVGWLAHVVDEYGQAPLRLRPESDYTGPRPAEPAQPSTSGSDLPDGRAATRH